MQERSCPKSLLTVSMNDGNECTYSKFPKPPMEITDSAEHRTKRLLSDGPRFRCFAPFFHSAQFDNDIWLNSAFNC